MEVEITLKLRILCDNQEMKDAIVNSDGTANIGFLSDAFDIMGTELVCPLVAINDLTQDDLRKRLSEAAGV